jgi:predicted  nucleic acid-binding Zn-ribbon protein
MKSKAWTRRRRTSPASLTKAKKDIEGLQNNIKTLETSLGASKDLVASTQQTLEVRIALFFASPYT